MIPAEAYPTMLYIRQPIVKELVEISVGKESQQRDQIRGSDEESTCNIRVDAEINGNRPIA